MLSARTPLDNAQANLICAGRSPRPIRPRYRRSVGKNPEALTIPPGPVLPSLPDIPVGVPSTLLQVANHVWSLGADVGLQLVEGGLRHARVAAARAGYDAAVANYRGSVLTAFQNVEDDLCILAQQAQVLDVTVHGATRAAAIAMNEYRAGTVDTPPPLPPAPPSTARSRVCNVQQHRLLAALSLIGDMGGWSGHELGEPQQPSTRR